MTTQYDPTIAYDVDYPAVRALTPKNEDESPAEFRARVAQELFDSGDSWTAYQVLFNTRQYVDYFYLASKLDGYRNTTILETAQIVQRKYEYMVAYHAEQDRLREEEEAFNQAVSEWFEKHRATIGRLLILFAFIGFLLVFYFSAQSI